MHKRVTNISSMSPLGGIDYDSELSVVSPQDVVDALNCRYTVSYDGRVNVMTNVRGNVEVPFAFTDRHECIGSTQNINSGTILYFLWCSDSEKHKIMRYHRKSSTNPYGFIEQLIEFPFGWTQLTNITGVNIVQDNDTELLYWTDFKPRKVNVGKASLLNKQKCWDLFIPVTPIFQSNATVTIRGFDINGTLVDQAIIATSTGTNKNRIEFIATAINSVPTRKWQAAACSCKLELCATDQSIVEITFEIIRNIDSQAFPTLVVPSNWYGVDLTERMFDAGKYPSGCNPLTAFGQDDSNLFNFVDEKDWQHRTRYYNDNDEITTLSSWSQIPLENITCNPTKTRKLNYIDVNFNDPSLLDPNTLVIVKEVGVTARIGNAGVEKEVQKVPICEFFDMDASFQPIAHYKFYNNTESAAIPIDDANQHFSALPITARGQQFFRDRIVYGGIVEGYDKPECIDATLTPNIEESVTPVVHRVDVIIRIYNPFLASGGSIVGNKAPDLFSTTPLSIRGGIFHDYSLDDDPINTYYGGHYISGGSFNYNEVVMTKYKQNLPEGGWTVYVPGTDYKAISRQVNVGLPDTQNGAIITSNSQSGLDDYFVTQNGDVYSLASLYLPDGTYTLRLASHWCSFGDKLGYGKTYDLNNGIQWQKTSTNVWGVKGLSSGNLFSVNKELTITVAGNDVYAGDFIVRDMIDDVAGDGGDPDTTIPFVGYVFDAQGSVDAISLKDEGIPVERSAVSYTASDVADFTDHNGYFFLYGNSLLTLGFQVQQVNNPAGSPLKPIAGDPLLGIFVSGLYYGSLQQLYDGTLTVIPNGTSTLNEIILGTYTADARLECSTIIMGQVVDQNGLGIEGVLITYQGGKTARTNSNGEFSIVVFGNTVGVYAGGSIVPPVNDNNRIADQLIISECACCFPTYTTPQVVNITITEFGANGGVVPPPYSPTAVYDSGTHTIDLSTEIIYKSRKRGGNYSIGLVHYDKLLRQSSVAFVQDVYIPFTTEDLSIYNPTLPSGTYRHGRALIDWTLGGNPPEWAAYYQWVITKNSNHQTFLTWAIKDAIYAVTADTVEISGVETFEYTETTFLNKDATLILLNIANIADYAKSNFDTNISYTWQDGDRVRFIADSGRVYYEGLFDYEAISFQDTFIVIRNDFPFEVKPGTLIQVYRPRNLTEEKIYYEFGNCYECTNPDSTANTYSVTSGTFTGGDTYFRHRAIPVYNDYSADLIEYYLECENISDFYESTDIDVGRLQIDSPVFDRIDRPSLLRATDKFFPNTKINGLNIIRDIDSARKELDRKDGWIIALETPDIILQVTQESAVTSVYIERTIIRDAQAQEVMATTTNYFGTDNRMLGDFGAQFGGAISQRDAIVYGVDTTRGLSWARSDNGLQQISHYQARNYFGRYREVPIWDVCSVYDAFMREYIVTIWEQGSIEGTVIAVGGEFGTGIVVDFIESPPFQRNDNVLLDYSGTQVLTTVGQVGGFPLTDTQAVLFPDWETPQVEIGDEVQVKYRGTADTIAFCDAITYEGNRKNRWVTRYSFQPEQYQALGDEFVSFKNGELWIHDKNTLRNNFYGVQYQMMVIPVFNAGQDPKMWFSIWIDSIQDNNSYNGICNWSAPNITNTNGQLSRLVEGSFGKKEQYWHSEFKRDTTTLGVTNPIVNGRVMRNAQLKVQLENASPNEVVLRSVNGLFEVSYRNTQ